MTAGGRFVGLRRVAGRLRPTSLAVSIVAIVVLLDAFVLGLAGLSALGNRQQYTLRAEIISRNLSAILAEAVAGYLIRIDTALQVVVDQVEHERRMQRADLAYLDEFVRKAHQRVPEVLNFGIIDADGTIRSTSKTAAGPEITLADRDYFRVLRDRPDAGLVISAPLLGRVDQEWMIVLSRRISAADGSFAGIASATLPLRRFSDLFANVDLRPDDAIALRGPLPSLGTIARYPETVGGTPAIGNQAVSHELQDMTATHPESGTYRARAGIDGIERVLSYHKVEGFPYYLVVGLSTRQLMAEWWRASIQVAAIAATFLVITALGGLFAWASLRARQTLEGRLKLIEFAFSHQAEAVLLLDSRGGVVSGNAAAAQLFQRDGATLAGTPVWQLDTAAGEDDWPAHWRTLRRGEPVTLAAEVARPDGSRVPVVVSANYFAFAGNEFEVRIIRDVTEQVRHEMEMRDALAVAQSLGEKLGRRNADLERFADILAHHMQEPVRQQHIFAQHLARLLPKPLAPEVQQSLDAILHAAQRHRALLGDARTYLAFDSLSAIAPATAGDAGLNLALERLEDRIARTQASIERAPLPPLPIATPALAEVFAAVLDNALSYTRPGIAPQIRIGAERRDDAVVVSVTDNGVGIPQEFAERVFGVFERLEPRPGQPGTGIGLALARRIIEAASGHIWVEQPDGPGTRVCFRLPVAA